MAGQVGLDGRTPKSKSTQTRSTSRWDTLYFVKIVNLTFIAYSYNSVVRFECPRAKGFTLVETNETTGFIDFKCQWDGTWDSDPNPLPICKCEMFKNYRASLQGLSIFEILWHIAASRSAC